MTRTWSFEDLEFVVLWEQVTDGDFLPRPFQFHSQTPMFYDYLREKREAVVTLRRRLESSFSEVMESIVKPDIRIVLDGWDGKNLERAEGRLRVMAVRKGMRGFVITQLPGETYTHGSGFTITECDPLRLADLVVGVLPDAEPGSRSEIALTPPTEDQGETDYEYGHSVVGADRDHLIADSSRRFLSTAPSVIGTIDIIQGMSVFGPRGVSSHRLEWRDLPGDGRYAIGHAAPWRAVPVDGKRMIAMVNARIAEVIRVIKDERGA